MEKPFLAPLGLAATLRAMRARAEYSQRELAEAANVPQSTLARLESGQAQNPTVNLLVRIVRAADADLHVVVRPWPDGEGLARWAFEGCA